jgi:transketolase
MTQSLKQTNYLARRIRIHALKMANRGGGSHIGSALSIIDILAVLYNDVLYVNPKDHHMANRDRFILSKGHAGAAVYATLAEVGFFPIEKLETHYQDGSDLSGHVSHKNVPGVELSTGSLGHGLSVGVGMAKAAKLDKKGHEVFVLLSDGECDEGSVWEAAMFASHHKLDNLIALIDYNKIQSLDTIANTLALEPFKSKWESFGWNAIEINGHDHNQLKFELAKTPSINSKPTVYICHTTKGKGVSFMENSVLWHYRCPRGEEFEMALKELKQKK